MENSGARQNSGFGADWWGLYLPATLVVACAAWWECMPIYTGYCLCICALVALILLVRANRSSRQEKLTWGLIAFVLFTGEVAVNYRAHTLAQTFAVCTFPAPDTAIVQQHGPATLRTVSMLIVNQDELAALRATHTQNADDYAKLYRFIPVGLLTPGFSRNFAATAPTISGQVSHYRVQLNADNGYWWEDFQTVRAHGHPVQALRIVRFRNGTPRVLFEQDDPAYPRDASGQVDWGWAIREP